MSTAARAAGVAGMRRAASRQSCGSVRASRPTSQSSSASAFRQASSLSPVTNSAGDAAPRPRNPSARSSTIEISTALIVAFAIV